MEKTPVLLQWRVNMHAFENNLVFYKRVLAHEKTIYVSVET